MDSALFLIKLNAYEGVAAGIFPGQVNILAIRPGLS